MIPTSYIELINWRIFEHQRFVIPTVSTILVDKNGSGKTSYLAAIYSLLTGQCWPQLKFADMLRSREHYFAVRSDHQEWFLSAKTSARSSVTTKFSLPEDIYLPRVALYQPDDNRWLFVDRQSKMDILDRIVMSVEGLQFARDIKQLNQLLRNKQRILRRFLEEGYSDEVLVHTYSRQIEEVSTRI